MRRSPVLAGETVEVEEWVGRGEGWRNALPELDERDIRFERDPVTRVPVAAWVRWSAREHFFDSHSRDRHYVIERATGTLRFGANAPDAGRRISVSYSSGGGVAGNVRCRRREGACARPCRISPAPAIRSPHAAEQAPRVPNVCSDADRNTCAIAGAA